MSILSLRQLTIEGSLGPLSIGAGRAAITSLLGEPEDRSLTRPLILRYGALELTIADGRLMMIAYYADRPAAAGQVAITQDLPRTRHAVERLLDEERVDYATDDLLSYDGQHALRVLGPGSLVLFEQEELRSVQVAARVTA